MFSLKQHISVSVVIPTFNRDDVLVNTIESVLNQNPLPDEFWIIDQTVQHDFETEKFLVEVRQRGVKVVRLQNPGVCFARNLGAALSNSDVILYLDDDVVISNPAFIEAHRGNYIEPAVAAVQGQILEVGQKTTQFGLRNGEARIDSDLKAVGTKTVVTANVSIRRDVILSIGGYDEGFSGRTYANEDGDFGLRLFDAGYRIDYDPAASLIHLKASTGGNRIIGRDSFPEWTRSVTFFQYALRHFGGWNRVWQLLRVFRIIALRKENVQQFWFTPVAVLHAFYGLLIAVLRHRRGFRSSILSPGVAELQKQYLS